MAKHASRRTTQHRTQRESDAKERSRLAREVSSLRREVARLRSERDRAKEALGEREAEAQENQGSMAQADGTDACEKCGSHLLVTIDFPRGRLSVCKDCKHRRKL